MHIRQPSRRGCKRSMHQPSVLLISYHFHPSHEIGAKRPTALAQFLASKGVRVAVVSAFGGHNIELGSQVLPGVVAVPVPRPSRWLIDFAIRLKRKMPGARPAANAAGGSHVPSPPVGSAAQAFWGRVRDVFFRVTYFVDEYKGWGRRARRAAVNEGRRHPPKLVLSSSPPPTVLLVGMLAARRLGVPHIVDLRDPWTDQVASTQPTRRVELALLRGIEGRVMRAAAAITSTGARVAQLLIQRQPGLASKTFVVRNGYDGSVRQASADTSNRLAILFAGELYLNRDPFPLLHALERLLSRPGVDAGRITVTFMGQKTEDTVRSIAAWLAGKRCAGVVKFLPRQPPEVVAAITLESTVLLNLAQLQPLSIPAKTFEHLASGRENLLLCEDDSESAQLVANIPGVLQVDPQNPDALDRVLRDLYERHVVQGRLVAPAERDVAAFSRIAANETFWRIMSSTTTIDVPVK